MGQKHPRYSVIIPALVRQNALVHWRCLGPQYILPSLFNELQNEEDLIGDAVRRYVAS